MDLSRERARPLLACADAVRLRPTPRDDEEGPRSCLPAKAALPRKQAVPFRRSRAGCSCDSWATRASERDSAARCGASVALAALGGQRGDFVSLAGSLAGSPAARFRPRSATRDPGTPTMSAPIRLLLLAGLALGAAASPALAPGPRHSRRDRGRRDRLYQDQNGAYYLRRGDRYVPIPAASSSAARCSTASPRRRRAPRPAAVSTPEAEAPPARQAALVQPGADGNPPSRRWRPPRPRPCCGPPTMRRSITRGSMGRSTTTSYPVRAFDYKKMNPAFLRQEIAYRGPYEPGTIIVDPRAHQLTLVKRAAAPAATASAWASRASRGPARRPSTPSRRGRIGTRRRR